MNNTKCHTILFILCLTIVLQNVTTESISSAETNTNNNSNRRTKLLDTQSYLPDAVLQQHPLNHDDTTSSGTTTIAGGGSGGGGGGGGAVGETKPKSHTTIISNKSRRKGDAASEFGHNMDFDATLPDHLNNNYGGASEDDDEDDDDDEDGSMLSRHFTNKDEHNYSESEYEDDEDEEGEGDELGPPLDNFGAKLDPAGDGALPLFLAEPQSTYVVKNRPAILKCKALHALKLSFKCSGSSQPQLTDEETHVDPHSGVSIMEVSATVSKDLVFEYFGKGPFKCECHAWSPQGKAKSQSATVEVAYIKKQFTVAPSSVRVEIGGRTEMRCVAPDGVPPPKIKWLRNNNLMVPDSSALITAEGTVLISHASLQDMTNYTCVAENIAGKRMSDPANVTVYVDGGWGSWGAWTECKCPGKLPQGQKRSRTCINPSPLNGGAQCTGHNVQRTPDCTTCPGGRWSAWSDWSTCTSECIQIRRRTCLSVSSDAATTTTMAMANTAKLTLDANKSTQCSGRDLQTVECRGGSCYIGQDSSNWALYLTLVLVAAVCVGLGAALTKGARKGRNFPSYTIARAEMPPKCYQNTNEKKDFQFQPDLTVNNALPNYEYPVPITQRQMDIPLQMPRSISEHHYDVPNLSSNYASPMDKVSHGNASYSSSNYSRRIQSTDSLATSANTSDSTYDVATEPPTLPMSHKLFAKSSIARQHITVTGGALKLCDASITLLVPELSLPKHTKQAMFLTLLNDDHYRMPLTDNSTHLSPIVQCGPTDVCLTKPIVLKLPHCADTFDKWRVSLYQTTSSLQDTSPEWKRVVTLGEETINTSAYIQIDEKFVYIMTEFLGGFALIGESFGQNIVTKRMRLLLFGPSNQPSSECNIRVYVVEDYATSKEQCCALEEKLGGTFWGQSAWLPFQDNEEDLMLAIKCIGGWRPKSGTDSQKIPFSHVWHGSASLHCAFALEQTAPDQMGFKIEIHAGQKQGKTVNVSYLSSFHPIEMSSSSPLPPMHNAKETAYTDSGVLRTNFDGDSVFRLRRQTKHELCKCLDPPTNRGNDWRMLAQRLRVDRYIAYFATKSSPTEQILDLWECRNRDANALAELIGALRCMERMDAVRILEKNLGPSWI